MYGEKLGKDGCTGETPALPATNALNSLSEKISSLRVFRVLRGESILRTGGTPVPLLKKSCLILLILLRDFRVLRGESIFRLRLILQLLQSFCDFFLEASICG